MARRASTSGSCVRRQPKETLPHLGPGVTLPGRPQITHNAPTHQPTNPTAAECVKGEINNKKKYKKEGQREGGSQRGAGTLTKVCRHYFECIRPELLMLMLLRPCVYSFGVTWMRTCLYISISTSDAAAHDHWMSIEALWRSSGRLQSRQHDSLGPTPARLTSAAGGNNIGKSAAGSCIAIVNDRNSSRLTRLTWSCPSAS